MRDLVSRFINGSTGFAMWLVYLLSSPDSAGKVWVFAFGVVGLNMILMLLTFYPYRNLFPEGPPTYTTVDGGYLARSFIAYTSMKSFGDPKWCKISSIHCSSGFGENSERFLEKRPPTASDLEEMGTAERSLANAVRIFRAFPQ